MGMRRWRAMAAMGGDEYFRRVRGIAPASLIGYWPQWDKSGSVMSDVSGLARHGAYTGATLNADGIGDGKHSAFYDGINDFGLVIDAGYSSAFSGAEMTVMAWVKVANAGVWTDGEERDIARMYVDGTNFWYIRKGPADNNLQIDYSAGGTFDRVQVTSYSPTAWICVLFTVSSAADQMRGYINGVQISTTQTGIGTFAGMGNLLVAAGSGTPLDMWSGNLAHLAVWNTPLTPAQALSLGVL